jgi:hypothetical protein
MDEMTFKKRTKQFAISTLRLVEVLPQGRSAQTMETQLFRSASSVGANYRAACRGKSTADSERSGARLSAGGLPPETNDGRDRVRPRPLPLSSSSSSCATAA